MADFLSRAAWAHAIRQFGRRGGVADICDRLQLTGMELQRGILDLLEIAGQAAADFGFDGRR
jgi:hypothetical protein